VGDAVLEILLRKFAETLRSGGLMLGDAEISKSFGWELFFDVTASCAARSRASIVSRKISPRGSQRAS
jgi:hypothetical protein